MDSIIKYLILSHPCIQKSYLILRLVNYVTYLYYRQTACKVQLAFNIRSIDYTHNKNKHLGCAN